MLADGVVRVTAAPTDHAPVRPTVGYRVDDGGASVVIAGDTVPCAGLDELCAGADMLVHTVVRRDLLEPIELPRLNDVLDYHSTVEDAARTAARGGVGTLVLTHLVPAPRPEAEQEWVGPGAGALRRHRRRGARTCSRSTSAPDRQNRPGRGSTLEPQKTIAPAWARGSLGRHDLLAQRGDGDGGQLEVPEAERDADDGEAEHARPRTTWAIAIQSPARTNQRTLATVDGAPASGLRTTARPNGHSTNAASRKQATPKGMVMIKTHSTRPASDVADGQPQAREHQPQQVEHRSHRRSSVQSAGRSGRRRRRRRRRRRPRRAAPRAGSPRRGRRAAPAPRRRAPRTAARSASAGLRASTGPWRYVPTTRPCTAPSLPSPSPLPTPAMTRPSGAVSRRARRAPPWFSKPVSVGQRSSAPGPRLGQHLADRPRPRRPSPCRRRAARRPRGPRRRRPGKRPPDDLEAGADGQHDGARRRRAAPACRRRSASARRGPGGRPLPRPGSRCRPRAAAGRRRPAAARRRSPRHSARRARISPLPAVAVGAEQVGVDDRDAQRRRSSRRARAGRGRRCSSR